MGKNRNASPVWTRPLLEGLQRKGFKANISKEGYIVVNIPHTHKNKTLNEANILLNLQEVLDSVMPPSVPGGIIIGDPNNPEDYIVIPPGTENQVLTIIGGIPTWVDAVPSGQVIYDAVFATEAEILALNPTTELGKVYWAFDTKQDYRAITGAASGDHWQDFSPADYNPEQEAWGMPTTGDGHSLDLGQETFISGVNVGVQNVTALDPKVFGVSGVLVNPKIKEFILVKAGDIGEGSTFGINTVEALVGVVTKVTTFGTISGVNTSAWAQNDILYIDEVTPGELTTIKPATDAFVVGVVYAVHATEGVIEVIASRGIDTSPAIVPAGFATEFFTADVSDVPPMFSALEDDKGIIASALQTINVNDNQKLPFPTDFLAISEPSQIDINTGNITAFLEVQVSSVSAAKKMYIEAYHADAAGVPIDVPNTLPVGDLGVRPIVVLESFLIDPATNTPTLVSLEGLLPLKVTLLVGERIRYHVLGEKVGTQGGALDIRLYHGSTHFSSIAIPKLLRLNDLLDVVITTPANDQVLTYDAASGNWQNKTAPGGGGGTPGGLTGAVQFNDAGAFGGSDTQFFWDKANSRLGIGTNSPVNKLEIAGVNTTAFSIRTEGAKEFLHAGNIIGQGGFMRLYEDAGINPTIFLGGTGDSYFNGGNIGIGTNTPSEKLVVKSVSPVIAIEADADNYAQFAYKKAGLLRWILRTNNIEETGSNVGSDFEISKRSDDGSDNGIAFFIKRSSGNIGIGTSTPEQILHIAGDIIAGIRINRTSTVSNWEIRVGLVSAGDFVIRDAEQELNRLSILADGNVGIGTATPSEKLNVAGNIKITGGLLKVEDLTLGGTTLIRITAADDGFGRLDFGSVSAPDKGWIKYGNTSNDMSFVTNQATRLTIAGNGNAIFSAAISAGAITSSAVVTATNFQLSSDIRYKNVLEDLGGNEVKYIKFNTDEDKRNRYGVSAQQLQKVEPDLVEEMEDGKLTVKYIDLLVREVARLTNEVNELKAKI